MHRLISRRTLGANLLLGFCLVALAAPLRAASTSANQPFTPQGSGSTTPNGDYISTSAAGGGLNAPYRYFIEVPSGLTRLVVDIWDADIGLGGAGEDDAGRDRDRGGYDTAVSYTLFNPGGAQRNTLFTTGNTTLPAGSDNAWVSLFDSTGDTVRDNFGTAAYTNNDGLLAWANNWTETNDNNNATSGQILITGGELRINDSNAGNASTIDREANLTAAGFTTATLSFNVRTTGVEATDTMLVQISANGGGSYTTLETFTGAVAAATRSYNITTSIATNTRVRFIRGNGYAEADDFFFVDNVQIQETGIDAGHWEVRVDQTSTVTAGNDINAFGLRAHDGTAGAGGTELNVYYDSQSQLGVNPDPGANTRDYKLYPYLSSGCSASKNDFDFDSDSGNTGALKFTSRTGTFVQNYASTLLSVDDTWDRQTFSGWTSDSLSGQYGIWTAELTINTYGATSGNYTNLWMGNYQAAANPPAANPTTNAFRVYLPTDADVAPLKPYLDQTLTFTGCGAGNNGPNPPQSGQTSCFTVTVRVVNPTVRPIVFSTPANIVTANIPGTRVLYAGPAFSTVSQGTITAQPAVGGSGNITWNPGTVNAGVTALLAYRVKVTPTAAGQRNPMTATPASGNGTRAQFVDETGNTSQARSTYLFGPLCELATTVNAITEAVVSDVHAWQDGGGVRVEWRTASETGTSGFYLDRLDRAAKSWVRVSDALVPALQSAPQGGTYRFLDGGAAPGEPQVYRIEEVEAGGRHRMHGPYALAVDWQRPGSPGRPEMAGAYDRAARPATGRVGAGQTLQTSGMLQKGSGGAAGMHLTLRRSGLYSLSSSQVASWLGLPQAAAEALIAAGEIELTRGGRPVAWMPDFAASTGTPGKTAQGLLFYGEALDGIYAQGSVYRLRRGKGLLMATRTVTPSSLRWVGGRNLADGDFPESLHLEQDAFPATVLNLDPESDYWFWEFLVAGDGTYGHRTFSVDAPGLATDAKGTTGAATLTVSLQGATDSGAGGSGGAEHHALVTLNGTLLGETSWQGITAHSAAFAVPPGLLRASANEVEVTAALDAGIPYSIVYVDGFDLSYRRALRTYTDSLAFTADLRGAGDMTAAGFSSPSVRLLDVRDPLRPVWLSGGAVTPESSGTWSLRFAAEPGGRYLAAAPAGFPAPAAARGWSAPSLLAAGNRADYLVVAPAAFHAAAQRLADLRRNRGLETQVVDLEQIYDEINNGAPSPHAVQGFLSYAYRSWALRPRYAVLAGAGSLDYRDLLGFGDSLVPPLLVRSEGGLFPSDNGLADVDFDGLPEMAIGRLPVLSGTDLDAYTDKIAAYESGGAEAWARNVLFLSDTTDAGTEFAVDSDRVAAQLGSQLGSNYLVEPIALQSTPLAAARAQLLSGLNSGAALVNYMGHGALDRISSGGLLTNADAAALANGDRLPVFTAMTCTINRFTVPGLPSLGEALVGRPAGGAAAVWGPSGLADNSQSRLLAESFYRALSDSTDMLLGDRILRALGTFRGLGGDGALFSTYNLLGDPAIRLRRPPAPPASGGTSNE